MTGVSTLAQALRQIENIGNQQKLFGQLSEQLASGKKTQKFSGLGTDALTSVRSRTELTSLSIYTTNIKRANTTIGLSLTSIEEYQQQAREFSSSLINFVQEGSHQIGDKIFYDDPATPDEVETIHVGNTSSKVDADLQAVVDHAKNLSRYMKELLNTKEGDKYVFAGADSLEQPIKDNGTLDAAINTLISDWKNGTITTDELIADIEDRTAFSGNPNAITDTIIGYSASLSSDSAGKVFVRADENTEVDYTILANEDSLRNMIVALSVLKNDNLYPIVDVYEDGNYPGVPDAQGAPGATATEQQDNFYQLFNRLTQIVNESIDEIDQVRFRVENVRVQIAETSKSHADQKNLLQNTVSDIEDVDVNEVGLKISILRTQLEASYSATAISQQLSLVNFL
ncbi:MAG: flagellin [Alphaproteobacteria bacterium]